MRELRLAHQIIFNPIMEKSMSNIESMTLRDYFAAQALAGGLEQGVEVNEVFAPDMELWWHPADKIARRAYTIAEPCLT